MGSKARRTAISVAGLALASGATLALAAPASATTPANDDYSAGAYEHEYSNDREASSATAGSYTKIEKYEVKWAAANKEKDYSAGKVKGGWAKKSHDDCDDKCDPGRDKKYHHGGSKWKHSSVKGLHRSYKACKAAGVRGVRKGMWDSFDCDFTKRGYKGWHQSWNKYGANDWRCKGSWKLKTWEY